MIAGAAVSNRTQKPKHGRAPLPFSSRVASKSKSVSPCFPGRSGGATACNRSDRIVGPVRPGGIFPHQGHSRWGGKQQTARPFIDRSIIHSTELIIRRDDRLSDQSSLGCEDARCPAHEGRRSVHPNERTTGGQTARCPLINAQPLILPRHVRQEHACNPVCSNKPLLVANFFE